MSVRENKGIAFIVTLWLLVIITTIALTLAYQTQLEAKLASYQRDELAAFALAHAGLTRVIAELQIDQKESGYDSLEESWKINPAIHRQQLGIGYYEVIVTDEESKLNLNVADEAILESIPGIDDSISDAILDWRDSDDLYRLNGAEDLHYQSLDYPYHCKDGNFDTVEELRLVRGITPVLFLGEDSNQNGTLDYNEDDGDLFPPLDNADGILDPGLRNIFTVYTDGKININTASAVVLTTLFPDYRELANYLIDYRETIGPFKTPQEIFQVPEINSLPKGKKALLSRKITVSSFRFTIESRGIVRNGKVVKKITAVIDRSSSPFKIRYWREG